MRGQESGSEHERETDGSVVPATPPPSFGQPSSHVPRIDLAGGEQSHVPPARPEPEPAAGRPWAAPDDGGTSYDWLAPTGEEDVLAPPPGGPAAPAWQPPPAFTAAAAGIQVWPSPSADAPVPPPWPAATGEPVEELSWPDSDEGARPGEAGRPTGRPSHLGSPATDNPENTVDTRVPAPAAPDPQEPLPPVADPQAAGPAGADRPDLPPPAPGGSPSAPGGSVPAPGGLAPAPSGPGPTGHPGHPGPPAAEHAVPTAPTAPTAPQELTAGHAVPPASVPQPSTAEHSAPAAVQPPAAEPPVNLPAALPAPGPVPSPADQPTPPGGFPVVPPPFPPPVPPGGEPPALSGPAVERGPFEPPSAIASGPPAPPAAAPVTPGRGRIILAAAAVAVVVGGIGTGAFFAYRSFNAADPQPVRPTAVPETGDPSAESPENIPTEELIDTTLLNSELTDPGKMTLADAFARKVTLSGTTFTRVKTHLTQDCDKAAAGAFATALEDGDCRRVLRATYVDRKKKYAVTTGVAVLPTRESAVKVDQAKNLEKNLWFRGLRGASGSGAERMHIAGGYAAGLVWGRYIVFSYATFADGHTPTAKEKSLGKLSGAFRDQTSKVVERRLTR
ncbi:hypothetical protein PS9374_02078 [Planomonospora sphaerica]|uniref:Uncharacterized protein n=1 Tax=Planomonospora sphaerica TaxID=161355 RepID=A0A171CB13_9ACTN|nr:hypothetical protein [Planomonospora sphaerica]GAT66428.1 hypothetical protein PS9374_02078 [Planomonospora sphaerica]